MNRVLTLVFLIGLLAPYLVQSNSGTPDLPILILPDIEIPGKWIVASGISTDLRWRGLELSRDKSITIGATYTSKEYDGFIVDTTKWFISASASYLNIPNVLQTQHTDIDLFGKFAAGLTGNIYNGKGKYFLSYGRSQFDGLAQNEFIVGMSTKPFHWLKVGGSFGIIDSVFGRFESAAFGKVYGVFDTWKRSHITLTYGAQENSLVGKYNYYEIGIDRSFGKHVSAIMSYTFVDDSFPFIESFGSDSFSVNLTYQF